MKWMVLAAAACSLLQAGETGWLEGSVRDGSNLVVPGTVVSCFQEETGFRFAVKSGADGGFRILVPVGHYKVTVQREGFRAIAESGVAVPAGGTRRLDFRLEPRSQSVAVTVSGDPIPRLLNEDAFVMHPDDLSALPWNDRTVTGLAQLAPGMLVIPANSGEPGQLSSLGARPNTNRYTVDGVSANNAVSGGGWPSYLPGARLPAMTALGTTHDLALLDSIQEVRVGTQGFLPDAGRAPGGNIAIQTKPGSNQFHGSLFYALRPSALGAEDWFTNSYPLAHGEPAFHNLGASAGGPLHRNRTFFFLSAERLDLRQVYAWTTTVPSVAYRQIAALSYFQLASLLDEFPLPNGPPLTGSSSFGLGELVGNRTFPSSLTAGSLRVDHAFAPHTRAFLRVALTPSWSQSGYTQINFSDYRNTVGVLGVTHESPGWTQDTRVSFSRAAAASRWLPLTGQAAGSEFYSQFPSFAADFSSISVGGAGTINAGENGRNRQDQIQISHIATRAMSNHRVELGFEYLQLRPVRDAPETNFNVAFSSPTDLVLGPAAPVWITYSSFQAGDERLHQISGFLQDTWRIHPRLQATFGARLLFAVPPRAAPGSDFYSVTGTAYSALAPGTALWRGDPASIDPAVSVAWRVANRGDTVVRASWTSFHDGDFGVATDQLNGSPNQSLTAQQDLNSLGPALVAVPLAYGYVSNLHIPVYRRWSVTLQQAWSKWDSIAISYSGMTGGDLLRRDTMFYQTGPFGQLSFATNDGASHYHGLNAAYRHTFARGLQGSLNYSWSHSIDLGSSDFLLFLAQPGLPRANDRGSSDFDVRHALNGALAYSLPGGWTISSSITARTGFPIDVLQSETLRGSAVSNYRPDLVAGVPIWVSDTNVPGGHRLNSNAFATPPGNTGGYTGDLGRNAIRGFGAWQTDVAVGKLFGFGGQLKLQLRAEAYNIFNHSQFADPAKFLSNPMFGISQSPLNLMLGSGSPVSGQSPAFQAGGPRILQLSIRLSF